MLFISQISGHIFSGTGNFLRTSAKQTCPAVFISIRAFGGLLLCSCCTIPYKLLKTPLPKKYNQTGNCLDRSLSMPYSDAKDFKWFVLFIIRRPLTLATSRAEAPFNFQTRVEIDSYELNVAETSTFNWRYFKLLNHLEHISKFDILVNGIAKLILDSLNLKWKFRGKSFQQKLPIWGWRSQLSHMRGEVVLVVVRIVQYEGRVGPAFP